MKVEYLENKYSPMFSSGHFHLYCGSIGKKEDERFKGSRVMFLHVCLRLKNDSL